MKCHGQQPHVAMVALLVSLHSIATRPSSAGSVPACETGYYQHDPIVLTCQGDAEKSMLLLTEAGTAHSFFYWRAPVGTEDLQATFTLSAVDSGALGLAVLEVKCQDKLDKEDANSTLLNDESLVEKHSGSEWSWSGNPENATAGHFKVWFRVKGPLHCNIEVHLINEHASRLRGYMEYSWAGISPCPSARLGCFPCPEDYCSAGEAAICDGGPLIECVPSSTTQVMTLPSTTLPGPRKKIEGAFEISAVVSSGTDVTKPAFKLLVQATLCAALHVPRNAIVKFRVIDVTGLVAAASQVGRLLQSSRDVTLLVGYRLLLPRTREEELISRLRGMGAGSTLLGNFSEILESHGVSVNGFKSVDYPQLVTKEEEEAEADHMRGEASAGTAVGTTSATTTPVDRGPPALAPMVSGIQSPDVALAPGDWGSTTLAPADFREPTWSSTQKVFVFGFAALSLAISICGLCACLQALSNRRLRASHLDSASRRYNDPHVDRNTPEDRHLLDTDGDSPARGMGGFPSGYEPVSRQDVGRFTSNEGM